MIMDSKNIWNPAIGNAIYTKPIGSCIAGVFWYPTLKINCMPKIIIDIEKIDIMK